jgi:hypothetical protein
VILALLVVAAVTPASARAQPQQVALVGTFTDLQTNTTGVAGGRFTATRFARQASALVLLGTVDVSFCIPDVDPKNCLASFGFAFPATVTGVSGTCDAIVVELAPLETDIPGDATARFTVDLEATPLVLTGSTRERRCALARRAATTQPLPALAAALNALL